MFKKEQLWFEVMFNFLLNMTLQFHFPLEVYKPSIVLYQSLLFLSIFAWFLFLCVYASVRSTDMAFQLTLLDMSALWYFQFLLHVTFYEVRYLAVLTFALLLEQILYFPVSRSLPLLFPYQKAVSKPYIASSFFYNGFPKEGKMFLVDVWRCCCIWFLKH